MSVLAHADFWVIASGVLLLIAGGIAAWALWQVAPWK